MLVDELTPVRVQVRQRGQLTIPRKLRESLDIAEGDVLTAVPVGNLIVLAPQTLRVPELSDQLADLMEAEGLSLADLLADLPRIREELTGERYRTGDEA